MVDRKTSPTMEEQLDKQLRLEGVWDLSRWREERSGGEEGVGDQLRTKENEEAEDVLTTIYADDTQSRASAKTKEELERRNSRGLTRVCEELKALRLKVNEDKTTYMILATQGRRARENLDSEIIVCGERVKSVKVGKALGILVSDDLMWKDQVNKVVKSCQEKLRGLWKCTEFLKQQQRKVKAEGVIMSRLTYCLEVVSCGRKAELEKMQGVQSAAARWVLQTRKRDWSLSGGLRKLGWLSLAQLAVYASLKLAVRVINEKKPERLYEILTGKEGESRVCRRITERGLKKMKATTRKAWSVRVLRWLELMPVVIKEGDMTKKPQKENLKRWIKHTIPVRGDRILWGQPLTGAQRRRRAREDQGPQDQGGGTAPDDERQREERAGPGNLPDTEAAVVPTRPQEGRENGPNGGILQRTVRHCSKPEKRKKKLMKMVGVKKRWRRKAVYGGLPCSQTAVVMTSPQGSRETGTTMTGQSGDGGKVKFMCAARLYTQACLPWGLRWDENLDRSWTRGGLGWKKGVG